MTKSNSRSAEMVRLSVSKRSGGLLTALLMLAVLLSIGASTARAQPPPPPPPNQIIDSWTGLAGTEFWNNAGNWSNGVPNDSPGNYYDVGINGTGDTVTFNASPTVIDTLTLGGGTLQDDGSARALTIGDASGFSNSGNLSNSGTINWGDGGTLTIAPVGTNAQISNNGTIDIGFSGVGATLQVNGDFGANNGTLTVEYGSTGTVTGSLYNYGGVFIGGNVPGLGASLNIGNGGVGSLENAGGGAIFSTGYSTMTVANNVNNYGGAILDVGASTMTVGNDVNNYAGATLTLSSSTMTVANDVNNYHGGLVWVQSNSALIVLGNYNNTNGADTYMTGAGSAALIVGGNFTNTSSTLDLYYPWGSGGGLTVAITGAFANNGGTLEEIGPGETVTAGSWANLDGSGNLTGGSTYYINGGRFLYTGGDVLNNVDNTIYLANWGSLATDAIGSNVLISHDGGLTSALDNLNTNSGTLQLSGIVQNLNGGLTNTGSLLLEGSSSMTTNKGGLGGDVTNTGFIGLNDSCPTCSGDTLAVGGNLTNSGTLGMGGYWDSVSTTGTLTNSGQIVLGGNGDSLTDLGDFNNNSGGSLVVSGGSDQVSVAGTFNNNGGASVTMNGTSGSLSAATAFINAGTVTLSGSGDTLTTPSFSNTGSVTIGSTETINATGANGYSQTAGTTQGTGTITALAGGVTISGGTILPGPGTLTITGNYTQGSGGTLTIDLGGTAAGEFSVLSVSGDAALDGTVDFVAVSSFAPATGDDFTFLDWGGSESGDFATIDFTNWSCPAGDTCTDVLGPGTLTLEIEPQAPSCPEPSALILLGTALLGIAAVVRRLNTHRARLAAL